LFGNLFTNGQFRSPPRRQLFSLSQKFSRSPLTNSVNHEKSPLQRTFERNFLGDVISCINQQQRQKLSPSEMKKASPKEKNEPKVLFTLHHPQNDGKEGQISGCEEEDSAEVRIEFSKDEGGGNGKCAAHDLSKTNSKMNAQPGAATKPEIKPGASYLSECSAAEGEKQLSPMSSAKLKTIFHPPKWKQPRSIFSVSPLPAERAQGATQQREPLWAHSCNSNKLLEKAGVDECLKKPLSVKSEGTDKLKEVNCAHLDCNSDGKCETSVDCAEKISYSSSNNGSTKSDSNPLDNICSDSLDDIPRQSKSRLRRKKGKKSAKSSDKELNACSHKASDATDIVANASKTEVYCKLCGITLSKPQCFYSLGSLCTDGEFCETDSDDINRHPVGDIDDVPPVIEIQSHHDTGYTSSDDFENESNLSKELRRAWSNNRQESGSYDGDYETDNCEETTFSPEKMSDDMALKPLVSVGEPIAIKDYALWEWKSDTPTSRAMKKGYGFISSRTGCQHLRQIRGDNYCAIRAVLFQALAGRLPIMNLFASEKITKLEKIPSLHASLDQWSFANRLPVPQTEVITTLEKFLAFFSEQIRKICDIPSQPERIESTLSLLNNETDEFKILEATKLLMYDAAVHLYKRLSRGEDVPVFAMLLFARDSCDSPPGLLTNHLNKTGDTGGLEQVEMCLLGYTLGVVIQVIRPSQVDEEDFIAYYPPLDDVPKYTPTVTLVAEDDRHYNIVM